jgi:hypothetical protein
MIGAADKNKLEQGVTCLLYAHGCVYWKSKEDTDKKNRLMERCIEKCENEHIAVSSMENKKLLFFITGVALEMI